jgi:hypothetical protein
MITARLKKGLYYQELNSDTDGHLASVSGKAQVIATNKGFMVVIRNGNQNGFFHADKVEWVEPLATDVYDSEPMTKQIEVELTARAGNQEADEAAVENKAA